MGHGKGVHGAPARRKYPLGIVGQTVRAERPWIVAKLATRAALLHAQLVALATNPSPHISSGAVYALALNRTDEGVKTLKTLLHDPDPKVSKLAEEAIRNAYTSRREARGRPLRADDFDAKFQQPEVTPSK